MCCGSQYGTIYQAMFHSECKSSLDGCNSKYAWDDGSVFKAWTAKLWLVPPMKEDPWNYQTPPSQLSLYHSHLGANQGVAWSSCTRLSTMARPFHWEVVVQDARWLNREPQSFGIPRSTHVLVNLELMHESSKISMSQLRSSSIILTEKPAYGWPRVRSGWVK
jgi:hypothetical protein